MRILELALAAAAQRFQPIAAKRSQVFKGSGRVEPDQASSNLFFDVHQFNDAMAAQQFLGSRILERLNHTPMVLLYGYREFRRAPLQAEPRQQRSVPTAFTSAATHLVKNPVRWRSPARFI